MKPIYAIIALFFIFATLPGADNPDSAFVKAGELYTSGNYEEAIREWSAVENQGWVSAELYYNLGNAYFRSNKLGKARLYYEKAILLDPVDEDIRANLEFVESMLTDRFEEVPVFFGLRWWNSFTSIFLPNTWLLITVFLFGLFIIAGVAYTVSGSFRLKRNAFFASILFLILSALTLMNTINQRNLLREPGTAVIMESSLVVKSAPRESAKDLFILHEGTKVSIETKLDEWSEIKISDGRKGWVRSKGYEEISIQNLAHETP